MRIEINQATTIDTTLNASELALKQMYQAHPNRAFDTPIVADDVAQLLGDRFQPASRLCEADFFRGRADVAVVRHLRYLPAIRHTHQFVEVALLLAGRCVNSFDDADIMMDEGDVCIVAPGTVHAVSAFTDDCILINVLIRSSTFDSAFPAIASEHHPWAGVFLRATDSGSQRAFLHLPAACGQDVLSSFGVLHNEFLRGLEGPPPPFHDTLLNAAAVGLLGSLLRRAPDAELSSAAESLVSADILRLVRENLPMITLADLAGTLSYSERQVQRIISTRYGTTFSGLVQRERVERAADLLARTVTPVSDVARAVGYSDVSNFRRLFRRHYAASPSRYRARAAR